MFFELIFFVGAITCLKQAKSIYKLLFCDRDGNSGRYKHWLEGCDDIMIPTNLAPGTDIICINNSPNEYGHECNLTLGAIYTVRGYSLQSDGTVSVLLNEIQAPVGVEYEDKCERGYYRWRFRLPFIPKVFYEMLETKKIDVGEKEPA